MSNFYMFANLDFSFIKFVFNEQKEILIFNCTFSSKENFDSEVRNFMSTEISLCAFRNIEIKIFLIIIIIENINKKFTITLQLLI